MSAEPQRPEAPEDVDAWIAERFGHAVRLSALDEVGADLPPNVAAWLALHRAWQSEHEEWGKRQPFNWNGDSWKWRMFGGEWISGRSAVECAGSDGERRSYDIGRGIARLVADGAPEAELRRIAGEIYEWRAMDRAAQERIARMLRRGE